MNRYRKLNHAFFHRKQIGLIVFAAVLALAAYPAWRVWAAAGDLDTSFSGDGRYTLPLAYPTSSTGYARNVDDILIQSDPNNIQVQRVIAAYSNRFECIGPATDYDFLVTRLTQSGTKDSTFGNNGYAAISFAGTGLPTKNGTVTALALQSNGKILVAGNLCATNVNTVGLARLTVDGDLDTTFSDDGLWFYFGVAEVSDMIVQTDGKILLAGRMKDSTGTYWKSALWRFNSNGTTDSSFGIENGSMYTTVWSGSSMDGGVREGFKSVYRQADGKIVALNNPNNLYFDETNSYGYRLRRFTASGAVDSSLQVNAAAADKGNSIRLAGSNIWVVGKSGDFGAIFARNSTDGSLVTSFGNNGKVVSSQPSVWMDSVLVPFSFPSRYVIAGWNKYPTSPTIFGSHYPKAVLMGYYSSGAPNLNFGTNGSVETIGFDQNFSSSPFQDSRYSSVRVGLSGKIVAGGQAGNFTGSLPPPESGVVARYWGN